MEATITNSTQSFTVPASKLAQVCQRLANWTTLEGEEVIAATLVTGQTDRAASEALLAALLAVASMFREPAWFTHLVDVVGSALSHCRTGAEMRTAYEGAQIFNVFVNSDEAEGVELEHYRLAMEVSSVLYVASRDDRERPEGYDEDLTRENAAVGLVHMIRKHTEHPDAAVAMFLDALRVAS